jgi:hypothetical protein
MRIISKLATIALTSGLVVAGFAGTALAAPGGTTTANVAVSSGITMTGLTPGFTLSGAPGATVTGIGAVSYNVETNNVAGYSVTVESQTATMAPTLGGNPDTIPIAVLTARDGGTGIAYAPLSSTGVTTVHTQAARSINGGDALTTDFMMRIPTVNADTYHATLNYVASTL